MRAARESGKDASEKKRTKKVSGRTREEGETVRRGSHHREKDRGKYVGEEGVEERRALVVGLSVKGEQGQQEFEDISEDNDEGTHLESSLSSIRSRVFKSWSCSVLRGRTAASDEGRSMILRRARRRAGNAAKVATRPEHSCENVKERCIYESARSIH